MYALPYLPPLARIVFNFLIIVRESPSKIIRFHPISAVNIMALLHALASATVASTTSLKG
ncbi:hypothetical protein ES332_A07G144400v1 [Gossypium tomentosum]|nr:hypothetical protein ES332_A07G144400v1 [Gossypium tomentosum]